MNEVIEGNKFYAVRKAGRCWNGAHRDSGHIIHAVIRPEPHGFWGDKALCGTEPGRSGYGWTSSDQPINCEKCLKKIDPKTNPMKQPCVEEGGFVPNTDFEKEAREFASRLHEVEYIGEGVPVYSFEQVEAAYIKGRQMSARAIAGEAWDAGFNYAGYLEMPIGYEPNKETYLNSKFPEK